MGESLQATEQSSKQYTQPAPDQTTSPNQPTYRFVVLVVMVGIAGFSQGMLLPVLAVMLEGIGVPPALNGLNAAALYIGILLASPFIEAPVRKYGYKPVIVTGLTLVLVSIILFPFWQVFWFWFMLRVIVGMGDNMIHFATQVWITSTSPPEKRGRQIAIYGLAFGLGFGIGPLMMHLLTINELLPFVVATVTNVLAWLMLITLRNERPESHVETTSGLGTWQRYRIVFKRCWFALLPCFGYGFLEAALHGNFPVYALRSGIDISWSAILLTSFVAGSLITQLPLGILSDRIGRRRLLLIVTGTGALTFISSVLVEHNMWLLLGTFAITGALIGSLFSLGIAYLADLLPKSLLPTGNVMAAVCFAIGSIVGPLIGGLFIQWFAQGSLYYAIGGMLLFIFISGLVFREQRRFTSCRQAV
ncbi:major facilitator superfamily MFS_1 [Caldalkalibacillus thermarum TA2.A1]|uniref:MFS transporter n=1 Tax=Caldalkalibacillus thermarum (strain TA2.A1) TaxID=986075 RepID=F5LAX2_CALTT|nr:MFS transporter [Caldalkalibacillus thermarum]EGL81511.1 major facilitator superfamily MFS_1 [Caldalkalibacillus thermarum TA2.A1]QZT33811.1 MFS transporter [Caldalkalibacillus thermarum TA2.A1]